MRIAILIAVLVLTGALYGFRKRRENQAFAEAADARATALQAFLASGVQELKSLLQRHDLDVESVWREAEGILAKMESRNLDGQLDAFIQDNRQSINEELARRSAS